MDGVYQGPNTEEYNVLPLDNSTLARWNSPHPSLTAGRTSTHIRAVLIGSRPATNSLWISSLTGRRYTTKNLGTRISKITLETIGIDVSPHLFRTAAATTSACYGTDMPHLGSAVLLHANSRDTEKHYIRTTTLNAAKDYAAILRRRRSPGQPEA
jgi:integrase